MRAFTIHLLEIYQIQKLEKLASLKILGKLSNSQNVKSSTNEPKWAINNTPDNPNCCPNPNYNLQGSIKMWSNDIMPFGLTSIYN